MERTELFTYVLLTGPLLPCKVGWEMQSNTVAGVHIVGGESGWISPTRTPELSIRPSTGSPEPLDGSCSDDHQPRFVSACIVSRMLCYLTAQSLVSAAPQSGFLTEPPPQDSHMVPSRLCPSSPSSALIPSNHSSVLHLCNYVVTQILCNGIVKCVQFETRFLHSA